MKKHFLSKDILVVLALFLIACQNKEIDFIARPTDCPVFYASIEDTSDPDTRVYVDENLKLLWNADDRVSIFNRYTFNQQYHFDGKTGDNAGTFSVVPNESFVTGNTLPAIYAVYPYHEATSITNDCEIELTLPAEQEYAPLGFGPGANTMVSATEDNNLLFKNIGGYLAVKFFGENISLSKVALRGNKGEKIAGKAHVTAPLGGEPAVVMDEDATEVITVICTDPITIGTGADTYTEFWFVLPPTTFEEGFTVTATDRFGGIFEKSTSKPVNITRNHLSRMSPIEFTPLAIYFDSADLVDMPAGASREIHYTIVSSSDDITVEVLPSEDIQANVVKTSAKTGYIQVQTSAIIHDNSQVFVLVNNGSQAIIRTLSFHEAAIEVADRVTKEASDEGDIVELEFFSNLPCHAVIPEEALGWISIVPETRGETRHAIALEVKPNDGLPRSATVQVIGDGEASCIVLNYIVEQDPGGVWKGGTIPPDNEIWYVTSDNTIINLEASYPAYASSPFDANVVSHTYENGRGVILCDKPITVINDHVFGNNRFLNMTHLFLPNTITTLNTGAICGTGVEELRIPDDLKMVGSYALTSKYFKRFEGKHVSEDGRCVIIEDGFRPDYGSTLTPAKNYMAAFAPSGLTEYTVPAKVEILGGYVFYKSPELRVIRFNEGLKSILGECFDNATLDCEIVFPSTLEELDPYAFKGCTGIKGFYGNEKFHTSDHLCLIFYNTWDGVYGPWLNRFIGTDLTSYTIPDGIIGIENYTFDELPNLQSVTFPSSLLEIGASAFNRCWNLEELNGYCVSPDKKGVVFGTQFRKLVVTKGVTEYTVPMGMTSLGYSSFAESPDLEEVIVPDSVTELGGYDFAWCYKLKKVVLSSQLERIRGNNPFLGSSNLEAIYFRSFLPPVYTDRQFYESDCSHLVVYVPEETLSLYQLASQWSQYAPYMVGYKYDDIGEWNPDFYTSSDFSHDGEVTVLQTSSSGNGINLVLMGDGFTDLQIENGSYGNAMQQAADAFFSEEPYRSFKDLFNVYYVNVVSLTEGYDHPGQSLGTGFGGGTFVFGNDTKVIDYAKKVLSEDQLDDALIIVMMNRDAYAGTCYMYDAPDGDYGRGLSIAYFPTSSDVGTFNGLVSHEAGGHGFAKLADEYAYEYMGAISEQEVYSAHVKETSGWWKNIDFIGDPNQVKWNVFIDKERYASEDIGCFEGAFTYWTGVWRPTENSIMRYNTGGFNAPSRYAIWYRMNKLAYGESWNGTFEDFVSYDAVNRTPAAVVGRKAKNYVEKQLPPLAPPVIVGHSWRDEL